MKQVCYSSNFGNTEHQQRLKNPIGYPVGIPVGSYKVAITSVGTPPMPLTLQPETTSRWRHWNFAPATDIALHKVVFIGEVGVQPPVCRGTEGIEGVMFHLQSLLIIPNKPPLGIQVPPQKVLGPSKPPKHLLRGYLDP